MPGSRPKRPRSGSMDFRSIGSEEIANAIVYAISQPETVNVNEMLIRPTSQEL